jgi:hypothetical protein
MVSAGALHECATIGVEEFLRLGTSQGNQIVFFLFKFNKILTLESVRLAPLVLMMIY